MQTCLQRSMPFMPGSENSKYACLKQKQCGQLVWVQPLRGLQTWWQTGILQSCQRILLQRKPLWGQPAWVQPSWEILPGLQTGHQHCCQRSPLHCLQHNCLLTGFLANSGSLPVQLNKRHIRYAAAYASHQADRE